MSGRTDSENFQESSFKRKKSKSVKKDLASSLSSEDLFLSSNAVTSDEVQSLAQGSVSITKESKAKKRRRKRKESKEARKLEKKIKAKDEKKQKNNFISSSDPSKKSSSVKDKSFLDCLQNQQKSLKPVKNENPKSQHEGLLIKKKLKDEIDSLDSTLSLMCEKINPSFLVKGNSKKRFQTSELECSFKAKNKEENSMSSAAVSKILSAPELFKSYNCSHKQLGSSKKCNILSLWGKNQIDCLKNSNFFIFSSKHKPKFAHEIIKSATASMKKPKKIIKKNIKSPKNSKMCGSDHSRNIVSEPSQSSIKPLYKSVEPSTSVENSVPESVVCPLKASPNKIFENSSQSVSCLGQNKNTDLNSFLEIASRISTCRTFSDVQVKASKRSFDDIEKTSDSGKRFKNLNVRSLVSEPEVITLGSESDFYGVACKDISVSSCEDVYDPLTSASDDFLATHCKSQKVKNNSGKTVKVTKTICPKQVMKGLFEHSETVNSEIQVSGTVTDKTIGKEFSINDKLSNFGDLKLLLKDESLNDSTSEILEEKFGDSSDSHIQKFSRDNCKEANETTDSKNENNVSKTCELVTKWFPIHSESSPEFSSNNAKKEFYESPYTQSLSKSHIESKIKPFEENKTANAQDQINLLDTKYVTKQFTVWNESSRDAFEMCAKEFQDSFDVDTKDKNKPFLQASFANLKYVGKSSLDHEKCVPNACSKSLNSLVLNSQDLNSSPKVLSNSSIQSDNKESESLECSDKLVDSNMGHDSGELVLTDKELFSSDSSVNSNDLASMNEVVKSVQKEDIISRNSINEDSASNVKYRSCSLDNSSYFPKSQKSTEVENLESSLMADIRRDVSKESSEISPESRKSTETLKNRSSQKVVASVDSLAFKTVACIPIKNSVMSEFNLTTHSGDTIIETVDNLDNADNNSIVASTQESQAVLFDSAIGHDATTNKDISIVDKHDLLSKNVCGAPEMKQSILPLTVNEALVWPASQELFSSLSDSSEDNSLCSVMTNNIPPEDNVSSSVVEKISFSEGDESVDMKNVQQLSTLSSRNAISAKDKIIDSTPSNQENKLEGSSDDIFDLLTPASDDPFFDGLIISDLDFSMVENKISGIPESSFLEHSPSYNEIEQAKPLEQLLNNVQTEQLSNGTFKPSDSNKIAVTLNDNFEADLELFFNENPSSNLTEIRKNCNAYSRSRKLKSQKENSDIDAVLASPSDEMDFEKSNPSHSKIVSPIQKDYLSPIAEGKEISSNVSPITEGKEVSPLNLSPRPGDNENTSATLDFSDIELGPFNPSNMKTQKVPQCFSPRTFLHLSVLKWNKEKCKSSDELHGSKLECLKMILANDSDLQNLPNEQNIHDEWETSFLGVDLCKASSSPFSVPKTKYLKNLDLIPSLCKKSNVSECVASADLSYETNASSDNKKLTNNFSKNDIKCSSVPIVRTNVDTSPKKEPNKFFFGVDTNKFNDLFMKSRNTETKEKSYAIDSEFAKNNCTYSKFSSVASAVKKNKCKKSGFCLKTKSPSYINSSVSFRNKSNHISREVQKTKPLILSSGEKEIHIHDEVSFGDISDTTDVNGQNIEVKNNLMLELEDNSSINNSFLKNSVNQSDNQSLSSSPEKTTTVVKDKKLESFQSMLKAKSSLSTITSEEDNNLFSKKDKHKFFLRECNKTLYDNQKSVFNNSVISENVNNVKNSKNNFEDINLSNVSDSYKNIPTKFNKVIGDDTENEVFDISSKHICQITNVKCIDIDTHDNKDYNSNVGQTGKDSVSQMLSKCQKVSIVIKDCLAKNNERNRNEQSFSEHNFSKSNSQRALKNRSINDNITVETTVDPIKTTVVEDVKDAFDNSKCYDSELCHAEKNVSNILNQCKDFSIPIEDCLSSLKKQKTEFNEDTLPQKDCLKNDFQYALRHSKTKLNDKSVTIKMPPSLCETVEDEAFERNVKCNSDAFYTKKNNVSDLLSKCKDFNITIEDCLTSISKKKVIFNEHSSLKNYFKFVPKSSKEATDDNVSSEAKLSNDSNCADNDNNVDRSSNACPAKQEIVAPLFDKCKDLSITIEDCLSPVRKKNVLSNVHFLSQNDCSDNEFQYALRSSKKKSNNSLNIKSSKEATDDYFSSEAKLSNDSNCADNDNNVDRSSNACPAKQDIVAPLFDKCKDLSITIEDCLSPVRKKNVLSNVHFLLQNDRSDNEFQYALRSSKKKSNNSLNINQEHSFRSLSRSESAFNKISHSANFDSLSIRSLALLQKCKPLKIVLKDCFAPDLTMTQTSDTSLCLSSQIVDDFANYQSQRSPHTVPDSTIVKDCIVSQSRVNQNSDVSLYLGTQVLNDCESFQSQDLTSKVPEYFTASKDQFVPQLRMTQSSDSSLYLSTQVVSDFTNQSQESALEMPITVLKDSNVPEETMTQNSDKSLYLSTQVVNDFANQSQESALETPITVLKDSNVPEETMTQNSDKSLYLSTQVVNDFANQSPESALEMPITVLKDSNVPEETMTQNSDKSLYLSTQVVNDFANQSPESALEMPITVLKDSNVSEETMTQNSDKSLYLSSQVVNDFANQSPESALEMPITVIKDSNVPEETMTQNSDKSLYLSTQVVNDFANQSPESALEMPITVLKDSNIPEETMTQNSDKSLYLSSQVVNDFANQSPESALEMPITVLKDSNVPEETMTQNSAKSLYLSSQVINDFTNFQSDESAPEVSKYSMHFSGRCVLSPSKFSTNCNSCLLGNSNKSNYDEFMTSTESKLSILCENSESQNFVSKEANNVNSKNPLCSYTKQNDRKRSLAQINDSTSSVVKKLKSVAVMVDREVDKVSEKYVGDSAVPFSEYIRDSTLRQNRNLTVHQSSRGSSLEGNDSKSDQSSEKLFISTGVILEGEEANSDTFGPSFKKTEHSKCTSVIKKLRKTMKLKSRNRCSAEELNEKGSGDPTVDSSEENSSAHKCKIDLFSIFPKAVALRFKTLEQTVFSEDGIEFVIRYVANGLCDEAVVIDQRDLILYILQYLSMSARDPIAVFHETKDPSSLLPLTESCLVSSILLINSYLKDPDWLPSLTNTMHQIILSKALPPLALCAICRVLVEICKAQQNKQVPIALACGVLKMKHKYSIMLMTYIVGVWQELFNPSSQSSYEERVFYFALHYGALMKCQDIDSTIHRTCVMLLKEFLQTPAKFDVNKCINILLKDLKNRCSEASCDGMEMMTTVPLVIFAAHKKWEWVKEKLLDDHIIPSITTLSVAESNVKALNVYCNLYAEICCFAPHGTNPEKLLIDIFKKSSTDKGYNFIQDATAMACTKLLSLRRQQLPPTVSKWLRTYDPKNSGLASTLLRKRMARSNKISKEDVCELSYSV